MPLYEFNCPNCGFSMDGEADYEMRNDVQCPTCDTPMKGIGGPNTVMFERGWYEHIAPTPIFCDSARELREACKKHDAYSPYLESSPWRRGL